MPSAPKQPTAVAPVMKGGRQARVLVIDDDTFVADLYATALRKRGFDARTAGHGQDGLYMAKSDPPDAVLLDILMPHLDGFETLTKFKSDDELKDIPIIMLTNLEQPANVSKAMDLGAHSYLVKGKVVPSECARQLKKALGLNR